MEKKPVAAKKTDIAWFFCIYLDWIAWANSAVPGGTASWSSPIMFCTICLHPPIEQMKLKMEKFIVEMIAVLNILCTYTP